MSSLHYSMKKRKHCDISNEEDVLEPLPKRRKVQVDDPIPNEFETNEGKPTSRKVRKMIAFGNDDCEQIGADRIQKTARTNSTTTNGSEVNNASDIDDDDDDDGMEKQTVTRPVFLAVTESLSSIMFQSVSAGALHNVVLSTYGNPYTWGSSDGGCLGRKVSQHAPENKPGIVTGFFNYYTGDCEDGTIIQAVAGDTHTLFLTILGNVYMCGSYKDYDSGVFCCPTPPKSQQERTALESCQPKPVHVFQIKKPVKEIYAGGNFSFALLKEDRSLLTWGFGNNGELARSATMTKPDPTTGIYDLKKPFYFDLTTGIPKSDVVLQHFLTPKPPLWGSAMPSSPKIVTGVACGAFHLLVAARDPHQGSTSHLYSSGLNNYGQLGLGDKGREESCRHELTLVETLKEKNIVKMAAGMHFSMALSLNGTELYSFGRADYGQLGLGEFEYGKCVETPTRVQFPPAPHSTNVYPKLTTIAAGESHSMAITIDHDVYTWGWGESGATGHIVEDKVDITTPKLLELNECVTSPSGSNDDESRTIRPCMATGGSQHSILLVEDCTQAEAETVN